MLDIENLRQDGIYEAMKELGRRTSPDVRQIDLDVLRTFRNHIMYRERYGIKQQALFHVLVGYSMYNPVSVVDWRLIIRCFDRLALIACNSC